jgi:hypothetical protein
MRVLVPLTVVCMSSIFDESWADLRDAVKVRRVALWKWSVSMAR